MSCHSEPVRRLAWESVPRARRRGNPLPPSAREVSKPKVLTEGETKIETGGAEPRPYAHLSRVCGTYIPVRPYASSTGISSTTSRPCRMAYSTVRRVPPSCPSNTAMTRPLCSTI